MFNGDTEDSGICRVGLQQPGKKWYDYEKGNGTQPDKLVIRDMTSEELEEIRRRKEQMKNSQKELEKDREKFERKKEEWEKSFGKKKCDGCGKELDSKSAKEISIGQVGSNLNRVYFCPGSDCSKNFFREKDQQRENNPDNNSPWGKKCAGCDNTINSDYIEGNGKGSWYCSTECANKHHKPKSEIEETQEKLQDLKSKLENSSNPNEKKQLEQEINDLKDHLKNQQKQNNPAKPSSPKESYGKIILTGAVIFSVVILVSTLIIRKKRKRVIKKRN